MHSKDKSGSVSVAWILSLLEMSIQCITFLAITVVAYFGPVGKQDSELLSCLIIVIPVIAAYFSRKYINNFTVFMICHVVMIVASVMLGNSDNEKFFNAVIMIVFVAYSIRLKNSAIQLHDSKNMPISENGSTENRKSHLQAMVAGERVPVVMVAIMVVGYIIGIGSNRNIIMNIEVILSIIFIVLQIIYNNMLKVYQVFNINAGKNEFPAYQLKNVTTFITVAAVIMVLMGMLLFYNGEYGNIFTLIGNGTKRIGFIFGKVFLFLLGLFGKESNGDVPFEEETTAADDENILGGLPEVEGSALMEALAETVCVALIIGIILGLLYLLKVYIKNFNETRKSGKDYIEYVKPKSDVKQTSKQLSTVRVKVSKEEKNVRKLYKQRVLKGTKGQMPDVAATPYKLTMDNITSDREKADRITAIYEKARYSNEDITEQDISIMKNI